MGPLVSDHAPGAATRCCTNTRRTHSIGPHRNADAARWRMQCTREPQQMYTWQGLQVYATCPPPDLSGGVGEAHSQILQNGQSPPPSTSLQRERKEQRWDSSRCLFWHGRRGLLWCWQGLALCLHCDILIGPLLRHAFRNGLTKCLHICLHRNLCCSQPKGMRVYLSVVSLDIK